MFSIKLFFYFCKSRQLSSLFGASVQTLFFKWLHMEAQKLVKTLEEVKFQLTRKPILSLTKAYLPGYMSPQNGLSLWEQCWLGMIGCSCNPSYSGGWNRRKHLSPRVWGQSQQHTKTASHNKNHSDGTEAQPGVQQSKSQLVSWLLIYTGASW